MKLAERCLMQLGKTKGVNMIFIIGLSFAGTIITVVVLGRIITSKTKEKNNQLINENESLRRQLSKSDSTIHIMVKEMDENPEFVFDKDEKKLTRCYRESGAIIYQFLGDDDKDLNKADKDKEKTALFSENNLVETVFFKND